MSSPQPQPASPEATKTIQLPPCEVAICVPTMQFVDIRWAIGFWKLLQHVPPNTAFFTEWRYGVAETREALYHTAFSTKPNTTHLFFLDSDVVPDENMLIQLLVDNKPIVSGVYYNSLFSGANGWINEAAINVNDPRYKDNPLVECDKVGIGATLMKREVFDELKDEDGPLFYYKIDTKNNKMMSEDFIFFEKTRKHGIKPWLDLRARALHLKNCALLPEGSILGPQAS